MIRKYETCDLDEIIVGDLCNADLPEQEYDVIYNSFVLEHIEGAEGVLARLLDEAGVGGIDPAVLTVRLGIAPQAARTLLSAVASTIVAAGPRIYPAALVSELADRVVATVERHHAQAPLEPGAPLQAVRAGLGAVPELGDAAIRRALADGRIEQAGGTIARGGWQPRLDDRQARLTEVLRGALESAGLEPPSIAELEAAHGLGIAPLLRMLERGGEMVQVEADRYYGRAALEGLAERLRTGMARGRVYGPSELRDLIGVSRKYLIPLLEYCDRTGVTDRQVDGRVIRGT